MKREQMKRWDWFLFACMVVLAAFLAIRMSQREDAVAACKKSLAEVQQQYEDKAGEFNGCQDSYNFMEARLDRCLALETEIKCGRKH